MRIYMFKSNGTAGLRAFAKDSAGESLPAKFGPWSVTGVITDEKQPPFRLPRVDIEDALNEHGFQLWRMKKTKTA